MQPVAESEWKVLYFNFTNNRDMTPVTATAGQRFVECLYLLLMNLYEIPRPGVSLVKAWEINLVLAWKFRQIE